MQFNVNDKQRLMGRGALKRAQSKALSSLTKFGDHVTSIDLTVKDVNGPRGGIDKLCRVMIKLRRKADVVITAKDQALGKAIAKAIERASRSVSRQIDRRKVRSLAVVRG